MAQNITQIPAPRVPLIDETTGLISREWFRFLNNQYQLTGGGTTSTTLADLELTPSLSSNTEDEIAVLQQEIEDIQKQPPLAEVVAAKVFTVNYGSFFSTQTQVAAVANTPYAITFNNTSSQYGVYIDPTDNTRIRVGRPAIYNMQFSIQLDKTAGGVGLFYVWPRVNGVNVPNSASIGMYISSCLASL